MTRFVSQAQPCGKVAATHWVPSSVCPDDGAGNGSRHQREREVAVATGRSESDFDAFYRDTARRVIHLVYASTGDLTLAQDCTQEAYSRAWQQWSKVSDYDDPL